MEYATLNNGIKMPMLGYGVFQIGKEECERCVRDVLDVGDRLIDTAQAYGNEREVGTALLKKRYPQRRNIFIFFQESLKRLCTDYVDLLLIHQPAGDLS